MSSSLKWKRRCGCKQDKLKVLEAACREVASDARRERISSFMHASELTAESSLKDVGYRELSSRIEAQRCSSILSFVQIHRLALKS